MSAPASGFSRETVNVLRNADRRLRSVERGDMTRRYATCKAALTGLAPLDVFYIAYFKSENSLVITYIYDGDQYLAPEVLSYSPGGVSHWIRTSRRPYLSREDNGKRLHRGAPLGDAAQLSQDAVVVPILDQTSGEAIGLMCAQSLAPDVFSDEFVRAMEWVARALIQSTDRDSEDAESLDLYELYPELDSSRVQTEADLVNRIGERLDEMRSQLGSLRDQAHAAGVTDLGDFAASTLELCERVQTEVADLVRVHEPRQSSIHLDLTTREVEIASLIARESLTNAALAKQLHISEKTVKTHVGNILKKLGITQRSAIAWTLPADLFDHSSSPA